MQLIQNKISTIGDNISIINDVIALRTVLLTAQFIKKEVQKIALIR